MYRGRRFRFCRLATAVGAAVLAALAVPVPAAAEPTVPDLTDYTEVDSAAYMHMFDFQDYSGGYQFSTPAGYRCRMVWTVQAPESARGVCWGELPGTSDNTVRMSNREAASFSTTDLAEFDARSEASGDADAPAVKPFTAADYPLLPAGSKIYRKSVQITCAVQAELTTCLSDPVPSPGTQHGFVLSPQGNELF